MTQSKGFNAFQLKCLMAFLMVFDHIGKIPHLISGDVESIFHALTRCVGVWFAFMAVEGFIHTHNRVRYMARLFLWSGVMFMGNQLVEYLFHSREIHLSNNIFLTLAFGVCMLGFFFGFSKEKLEIPKEKKISLIGLGVVILFLSSFLLEGGWPMLPFMLITYLFRDKPIWRNLSYLVLAIFLFFINYTPYPTLAETILMLLYNSDWLFITVLPFIYLYNGERGPQTKVSKYFFYIFYPAHLWLIASLAFFLS